MKFVGILAVVAVALLVGSDQAAGLFGQPDPSTVPKWETYKCSWITVGDPKDKVHVMTWTDKIDKKHEFHMCVRLPGTGNAECAKLVVTQK